MTTHHVRPGLREHLVDKGAAMRHIAEAQPRAEQWKETLSASCVADDLTGVRKLRIRDWAYIGDGGADFGGFNLGPSSPELLCGVVSTCLTHTYLIGAAWLGIPLDSVRVDVEASNNDAWFFEIPQTDPRTPYDFVVTVSLSSTASDQDLEALKEYATSRCPMLNVVRGVTDLTVHQRKAS